MSIGSSLADTLFLGVYLRIPLGFPCIELLVCLLLGEGSLGDSALEVLPQKDSLIRKDTTYNERRLCTDIKPCKSPVCFQDDGCRVCVRVVRADLLDETAIARCASVCHYNVEECEILLSVAL